MSDGAVPRNSEALCFGLSVQGWGFGHYRVKDSGFEDDGV